MSGNDDSVVRRVYLVVLLIPLVLVVALWAVLGADDGFRRIVFPAVIAVHGTLTLGTLTRRLSLRAVGPWVILSPAAVLVARLVTWELFPASRPDNSGLVVATLVWFGAFFALAFLVFGTRRGALVSLIGYGLLYLGTGWSAFSGMLADSRSVGMVVLLAAGHAALIGAVWVLARNVEQLAAARTRSELLELQATTDPLTGIANRRRLDDELQRLVAHARRYGDPLSVVLVDLDHFKQLNDTFGHEAGDRALMHIVAEIGGVVRETDVLGRWGGEEFLLLAPETDHPDACVLAERCRATIAASSTEHGLAVTASFGVATLGPDDDARGVMRRADLALYTAKSEGRNRVVGIPDFADVRDTSTADPVPGSSGEA